MKALFNLWNLNFSKLQLSVLALLLFVLFGFFINQNEVYAASYDLDITSTTSGYLCGVNDLPSCLDYLIIHDCSFTAESWTSIYWDNSGSSQQVSFLSTWYEVNQVVFSLSNAFIRIPSPWAKVESCTFTFTDSLDFSPSGTISITENGQYDVSNYAVADVNVVGEVVQGDYHDDLEGLRRAVYACGAVLLAIYFFYCIYRMIIKSTGGK